MTDDDSRAFPAQANRLPEVLTFVRDRCARLKVPREPALRLELIAEELFINAATHGYGADTPGTVQLALRDCGAEVELTAEDAARAFDPFAGLPEEGVDPRDRAEGGQGRVLVARLSSRRSYVREAGRNRVVVAVQRIRK